MSFKSKYSSEAGVEKSRSKDSEEGLIGRRRRPRPPIDLFLDYKDIETLKPFINENGKIIPARVTRLSRKQQRDLTREVKRARQLALLGFR